MTSHDFESEDLGARLDIGVANLEKVGFFSNGWVTEQHFVQALVLTGALRDSDRVVRNAAAASAKDFSSLLNRQFTMRKRESLSLLRERVGGQKTPMWRSKLGLGAGVNWDANYVLKNENILFAAGSGSRYYM